MSSRTTSTSVTASSVAERGRPSKNASSPSTDGASIVLNAPSSRGSRTPDRALGQQVERAVVLARLDERQARADPAHLGVGEDRRPVGRGRLGHEQQVGRVLVGLLGEDDERARRARAPTYQAQNAISRRPSASTCLRAPCVEAPERLDRPVGAPGPGHLAVDEERADRLRHLRVEDLRRGAPRAGSACAARGEQGGVPGAEEAHRRGRVRRPGSGRSREVEQLGAVLGLEAAQRRAVRARARPPSAMSPAQLAISALGGGPEAREVAA